MLLVVDRKCVTTGNGAQCANLVLIARMPMWLVDSLALPTLVSSSSTLLLCYCC